MGVQKRLFRYAALVPRCNEESIKKTVCVILQHPLINYNEEYTHNSEI